MMERLNDKSELSDTVATPRYRRDDHGVGIVHLGLGAFHKAHQAVYTDDALAASGGNWRIAGVSLRSATPSEELSPQNGLYSIIERDTTGSRARVIGSMANAYCLKSDRQAVLDALCASETRIVSLTVTEKGYGIDRATGGIDTTHPAIAADLLDPAQPVGVAGLLVWALGQRFKSGVPPFTVLCCDNLPENGAMVRGLLVDFARRVAPELAPFISESVSFPSTMVDRITPARSDETLTLAKETLGHFDAAAIECETFRQWIIEDRFPEGRPEWEAGGAIFVENVKPFEEMKLRMLNGAHSMLAYSGFLAGHKYVRKVMEDPHLSVLVRRHLNAAASTLDQLPGVDLGQYASDLALRFSNPHLAHETYQIAMDGSEKMPQRIFAPAADAMIKAQPIDAFAFATAAWIRYLVGQKDDGTAYELRDPMQDHLQEGINMETSAADMVTYLNGIPGLVPEILANSAVWCDAVAQKLESMLSVGVSATIKNEADAL